MTDLYIFMYPRIIKVQLFCEGHKNVRNLFVVFSEKLNFTNIFAVHEGTSIAVLNTVEFREVGRNASNVEMRKEKRRRLLR